MLSHIGADIHAIAYTPDHDASSPPVSHSYGSSRLPALGSINLFALEMVNPAQEIIRDYRKLVHPDRVPEYWNILPPSHSSVEQLDFALGA